jgi:branched-chain amino acid transport system ATP-binding protein
MSVLLALNGISKYFGGLVAVNNVSFTVKKGQIKAIIGPNGAGKTTIFDLITGFTPLDKGEIWFDGEKINGTPPYLRVKKGIARTFQNLELFGNMTVLENIMASCYVRTKAGLLACALRLPRWLQEKREIVKRANELLEFVGLKAWGHLRSSYLPLGAQRYLEIARALATSPKLLLLDEPASGLDPTETQALADFVLKIRERGITVFLVEH